MGGLTSRLSIKSEAHVIFRQEIVVRARRDRPGVPSVLVFQGPWYREAMAKEVSRTLMCHVYISSSRSQYLPVCSRRSKCAVKYERISARRSLRPRLICSFK